jgi:Fe-S-cluster-containing dehydrogenase component
MTVMAIVQDVDKCVRCNGCVITCKRTYQLKGDPTVQVPHQKVAPNQRMVIKPQRRLDVGPFVRFSCWHCTNPPCTSRCPWGAIKKDATGAVYIDKDKCTPDVTYGPTGAKCKGVCQIDCVQGGYIRIGVGSDEFTVNKAQKCTMCYLRAGVGGDLPTKAERSGTSPDYTYYSPFYPTRAVAELAHQPACVFTCPARAMYYDTRANWIEFLTAGMALPSGNADRIVSYAGDGNMFWFSRKGFVSPPKADPFLEDHVSPMVGNLLNGPFARAALVPTLVAGGLLALSARRAKIEAEQMSLTGGEA